MKKAVLTALAGLALTFSFAQTATDWTVDDCAGNSHSLFSELDAGKVVVIGWTMPCGTCIGSMQTVANTVVGYANPNVVFYLCDDVGNTTCSTVESWASTNSITANAHFSNAAIDMLDYGNAGMPKTVVLGGTNHTVYYKMNGTNSQNELQTAIDDALNSGTTSITENKNAEIGLSVFPNPAVTNIKINYTLATASEVKIDVTNIIGEIVSSISLGKQNTGKHECELNLEALSRGFYIIKLNAGEITEIARVTVPR